MSKGKNPKLIVEVRRGLKSNIANKIKKYLDSKPYFQFIDTITVSQNCPCRNPKHQGWHEEIHNGLNAFGLSALDVKGCKEVWYKTATLGGKSRLFVKY